MVDDYLQKQKSDVSGLVSDVSKNVWRANVQTGKNIHTDKKRG